MVIAALAVSGCSWLFMEHLPSDYDVRNGEPPMCSASPGWWILDLLELAGDLAVIGAVASTSHDSTAAGIVATNIVDGTVAIASAATGISWASSCKDARREWSEGQTAPVGPGVESDEARELRRERSEALKRQRAAAQIDAGVDAAIDASTDGGE